MNSLSAFLINFRAKDSETALSIKEETPISHKEVHVITAQTASTIRRKPLRRRRLN